VRPFLGSVLLCMLAVICSPNFGHAQTTSTEAQRETSAWAMVGESKDWVVILHGYARREHGRVIYAHAAPWVIWAGGGPVPRQYMVDFSVDGISCVQGSLGFDGPPGTKLSQVAVCKLVYPQSPSIQGENPQDFISAIRNSGRFVLKWNGTQQTVQWGRAFPEGIYPQPATAG